MLVLLQQDRKYSPCLPSLKTAETTKELPSLFLKPHSWNRDLLLTEQS